MRTSVAVPGPYTAPTVWMLFAGCWWARCYYEAWFPTKELAIKAGRHRFTSFTVCEYAAPRLDSRRLGSPLHFMDGVRW